MTIDKCCGICLSPSPKLFEILEFQIFFFLKNKHVIKTLYVSSIKQTKPWMWMIAECNWRSSRTIKKKERGHLYVILLDWCTTLSNSRHMFPLFLLSTVHVALMAFDANESISRSLLRVGFIFPPVIAIYLLNKWQSHMRAEEMITWHLLFMYLLYIYFLYK